jgi:hypothetical protein
MSIQPTPSSGRRRLLLAAIGSPVCFMPVAQANDWRVLGQGRLRFWGLDIYDATLRVGPDFNAQRFEQHRLSLDLHYLRKLYGSAIAERSLKEMQAVAKAQGAAISEADAQRWLERMKAVFPDVKAGDRIRGEHVPGTGASFWLNDKSIGQVNEPAFSALFFGIWLSPHTSQPALRQTLLGALPARG